MKMEKSIFNGFSPQQKKNLPTKIRDRIVTFKFSFSTAFYISLFIHVLIFSFLFYSSRSSLGDLDRNNYFAVYKAVQDIQNKSSQAKNMSTQKSPELNNEVIRILQSMQLAGENLSEKDKIELFKKILEGYMLQKKGEENINLTEPIKPEDIRSFLIRQGKLGLESGKKVIPSSQFPGRDRVRLNVLPKSVENDLEYFRKLKVRERDYSIVGDMVSVRAPFSITVPADYFFREPDFEDIIAQGPSLFFIVEGFPRIEDKPKHEDPISIQKKEVSRDALKDAFDVFLVTEPRVLSKRSPSSSVKNENELDFDEELDRSFSRYCDGLMALPEETQFLRFNKDYLEKYDPNDENLVSLTKRFIYGNLSNIIIVVSDISAAFDYIEEAYFNKTLNHEYYEFWRKNPNTKTGSELLLCLASHYGVERKALEYIFQAYKDATDFLSKSYYVAEIYKKKEKCYVIKNVYERVKEELEKRGYSGIDEISKKYFEEQVRIYDHVISLGGTLKNDALYALGFLYWDLRLYDLALATWNEIDDSYHSDTLNSIKNILSWNKDKDETIVHIESKLNWIANRDREQQLSRLTKFKKWKTRYQNNYRN